MWFPIEYWRQWVWSRKWFLWEINYSYETQYSYIRTSAVSFLIPYLYFFYTLSICYSRTTEFILTSMTKHWLNVKDQDLESWICQYQKYSIVFQGTEGKTVVLGMGIIRYLIFILIHYGIYDGINYVWMLLNKKAHFFFQCVVYCMFLIVMKISNKNQKILSLIIIIVK